MAKPYHYNDPCTGEELASILWTSAKCWRPLQFFLEGLQVKSQARQNIQPDCFHQQVKEIFDRLPLNKRESLELVDEEGELQFPGLASYVPFCRMVAEIVVAQAVIFLRIYGF